MANRILIVDDNEHVRSSVRFALEDEGYECVESADSHSAKFELLERTPDAVILDILIQGDSMTGLDILKWMRNQKIEIPALILTTIDRQVDPQYLTRTYELGGDDYVGKRDELRRLEEHVESGRTSFLRQKGADTAELIARIRKLVPQSQMREISKAIRIDELADRVWVANKDEWNEISISPSERRILARLAREPGAPVSKRELGKDQPLPARRA